MDEQRKAELASAERNKKNMEAAFDRVLKDAGPGAQEYFTRRIQGEPHGSVTAEAREGAAKLAHGRGHIEWAEAEVRRSRGDSQGAELCEKRAHTFWGLRDQIRKG